MPKIKTHKGAAKRFKRTASGKIKRSHAYASHILTKKNRKRKRGLKKSGMVDPTNLKRLKRMIP